MQAHTGEDEYQLTAWRRVLLTVVLIALVGTIPAMLYAALHAHGPAPAVPGPAPVTVQPIPVNVTHGPPVSA